MTDHTDRLRRAGQRVRDWRRHQVPPLSLEAFAKRAKVSTGCVQSFERGIRTTTAKKVARIVAVIGVTREQLFSEDDFPDARTDTLLRTHPLLRDLRTEDFRLANAYHHAGADTKHAIKALFSAAVSEEIRDGVARILDRLLRFPDRLLHQFETISAAVEHTHHEAPPVAAVPLPKNHATTSHRR